LHEEDIDSYLFSIDLYGLKESLLEQGALVLNIDLKDNAKKSEILRFLKDKGLIFQDRSSLLNLAKIESISTLWYVVFFVLFLIVLVVYRMTGLRAFASIAFIVNAIPLVWFFSAIHLFDIALSMEILVAMIVTVALSSDATLHFISYYHDKRHKPRTAELALELSFLYVGTPLVMGNIILGLTFAALAFVPIDTISNIGLYSSLLITLSLFTDMFILPVMFLADIKSNKAIKDYNHSL
jgi:predicted RND superfamily exporter protein